jgi:hypothetical protein
VTTLEHAFISYARQDREFVDRLTVDLRAAGVRVWRDVEQILPGQNWEDSLEKALERAPALLYVSSRHAGQSAWMNRELQAVRPSVVVIPIIIEDAGIDNLPPLLRAIQWADFRETYETGLNALLRLVPDKLRGKEPAAAESKKSKGYVFLNYAEEDSSFVRDLKAFLKEKGFGYWDYEESDRDYHAQLFLELEGNIANAVAVLCIVSPDWKRSVWAVREFFFAEDASVPTFLLRARDPGPTLATAGRTYIDFVADSHAGFAKLGRELVRKGL